MRPSFYCFVLGILLAFNLSAKSIPKDRFGASFMVGQQLFLKAKCSVGLKGQIVIISSIDKKNDLIYVKNSKGELKIIKSIDLAKNSVVVP